MANIQLRVCGELDAAPDAVVAIADRVSPRLTVWVPPELAAAAGAGCERWDAAAGAAGAAAASGDVTELAARSGAGAGCDRAMAPSLEPAPVAGALTGGLEAGDWPGVYTGGSSSMVYSRTECPR